MFRSTRVIAAICLSALIFTACNSVPDHMRYIPKDAVLVTGINLRSLGKKIAWNMITGSKLFKEMQKRVPQKTGDDAISGIDKAGIDVMNTFYVYLKSGKTSTGGNKVTATALVPLSDAAQWEAYILKVFPQGEIKQHGDIRELSMGNNMLAGWNKNTLIVLSLIANTPDYASMMNGDPSATMAPPAAPDMVAELDTAFAVSKGNTIKGNANFDKLQKEGHDLSMWINYDQIMSQYMAESVAARMGGVSLSNTLWKGTAFACGFDFKKGKITGDMTYYTPAEMSEVYKELGSTSADKDMLERMPKSNLDMMMSLHLSPKGIKSLLEKTGFLGLANIGLSAENMNVDDVLDAFTGDMAVTVCDLSVQDATPAQDPNVEMMMPKTAGSICYVLKINKKENFMKLFELVKRQGMQPIANGYYAPLTAQDTFFVLMNDKYAVAGNKYVNVNGMLQGTFKGDKVSDVVSSQVYGHPFAMFLDIQQAIRNINLSKTMTGNDSTIYAESKKLVSNISLNGGDFKDNSITSHMEVNFTNTDENSIIALLDFGMRMSDATQKAHQTPAMP